VKHKGLGVLSVTSILRRGVVAGSVVGKVAVDVFEIVVERKVGSWRVLEVVRGVPRRHSPCFLVLCGNA